MLGTSHWALVMRIAVLAYNLRVAGGLSVGKNVICSLRRVADEHEYLFIMPKGVGYEPLEKPTRSTEYYYERKHGAAGQVLFDFFGIPRLVKQFKPDFVWALGNYGLANPGAPQAILYHQPYLLYDPAEQKRSVWRVTNDLKYVRWRLHRTLHKTPLVFCQTTAAAARFRKAFSYSGRVAIMPNAVSRFVETTSTPPPPKAFASLGGKFVLFCLTRFYPHKNLNILADLFETHRDALRDVAVILTVRPEDNAPSAEFCKRIEQLHLREHLISVGAVDQTELAGYFRHSRALILPTLLESFTGTYLEAMQLRCPILTSDRDFARVVCDDAAIYFDPFEVDDIRRAIVELRDTPDRGEDLVQRGQRRVESMFRGWDDIVTDAMREIRDVAATHGAIAGRR